MTSPAIRTAQWLGLFLLGLALYGVGIEVGYNRALVSVTPQERVDLKCRYGVQAVLSGNINLLDRELLEYYPLRWSLIKDKPPEEVLKYEKLQADRKLYAARLEQVQAECLRVLDDANVKR